MYLRNSGNTSAMLAPCEEDYDYSTVNYNPNPGEARGRSSCLYASNSFHTIRSQSQCAPLEGNNYKEASGSTPHVAENFECRDAIYSAREETSRKNLKAHVARNLGEGTDSAGISQYNVHHTIQKIPSILEHDGAWDPNVVDAVDNETPTRFQLPDFSQTNAEYTGEGEIQTKERKPQEELPAKPLKRGKASTASRYNGASLKGKLNARSLKKAYRNGISCPSESKDRHSKVVTSKGPRDRRMRLSIETALKFFALQDKLGYDQPSQAVEWLIQKSNYAISELPHILRMPPTEHSNTGSLSPVQSPQPSPTRGNPYTANAEYRPNFDEKIVEGSFVADLSTEPPVVLPYSAGNITPHESNENPKIFTGLPIEDDLWLEREGSNSRQLNTTAQRSSPRKGSRVMQSGVEARERAPHLGELSYKRAKRRTATCYSQQKTAPNSTEHISDEEDGNRLFVC